MIHLNQAASLALIYVCRATYGTVTMVNTEQVNEFWNIINSNLENMQSKIHCLTPDYMINPDELFFIYGRNSDNIGYYILKSDDESHKKRKRYIMELPLDVVLASQEVNALNSIGLTKIDDEIVKIEEQELTRVKENS